MNEEENRRADDDRESMWSVPKRFKSVYFPLFYLLGIIGISWSVWYEASRLGNAASYHDIANAVIAKTPAILLAAAFISLVTTETTMVLAEMVGNYLRKRNARMEAAAEARGMAQMNLKWAEWNRKRLEAEERGEAFDVPPPDNSALNGTGKDE